MQIPTKMDPDLGCKYNADQKPYNFLGQGRGSRGLGVFFWGHGSELLKWFAWSSRKVLVRGVVPLSSGSLVSGEWRLPYFGRTGDGRLDNTIKIVLNKHKMFAKGTVQRQL